MRHPACGGNVLPLSLCPPGVRLMASSPDITGLLVDWARGDRQALDRLAPLVYAELRRIAARQLRRERPDHTLQPTALVHEAYLKLVDQRRVDWLNRAHFYGVASRVMRRLLVDHARRHNANKRGNGVEWVAIDEGLNVPAPSQIPVLLLHDVIGRLEKIDQRLAQLVEVRVFGGCTLQEAAEVLDVSESTAKREWRTAKAWLMRELRSAGGHD
jgi:RNA polymerase sigma factor (TIGR02999 family)